MAAQAHILDNAVRLLKPGGRLLYVVCSLLDREGVGQFEALLSRHPQLEARPLVLSPTSPMGRERGEGVRLTPHHDGTDGFFIACAAWPC